MASKQFVASVSRGAGASSSKAEEDKILDLSNDLNKLRVLAKFEQELHNNVAAMNTEMHERRLKSLQEVADKLKEDSWKYTPIEKLLGL